MRLPLILFFLVTILFSNTISLSDSTDTAQASTPVDTISNSRTSPSLKKVSSLKVDSLRRISSGVEAIYLPGWNLVTLSRIDSAISFCERNGINTIILDLKNVHGEIFFGFESPRAKFIDAYPRTAGGSRRSIDFAYLWHRASEKGIRLVGRFVMFRDIRFHKAHPELSLESKESWIDFRKDEVLEYVRSLLREAVELPLDELALDYIRYPDINGLGPSDEKLGCIEEFVAEVAEIVDSAEMDLGLFVFGWTAWNRKQNIGQSLTGLAHYADVIYPMLYPSHFYSGSLGFKKPEDHPYDVIEQGYVAATEQVDSVKIIPMIQVFWYSPALVLEQVKAVYINDMPGYGCWNPSGNYIQLQRALNLLAEQAEKERTKKEKAKRVSTEVQE